MKTILFFAAMLLMGVSAQAQIIFKCQPRNFSTPAEPAGFDVVGISAAALSYQLGDTTAMQCYFQFYQEKDSSYVQVGQGTNADIPKDVTIDPATYSYLRANYGSALFPEVSISAPTTYHLHSMLFGGNKEEIYKGAVFFALAKGYTLLPIARQTFLNSRYP